MKHFTSTVISLGYLLISFAAGGWCNSDPAQSVAPPGVIFELLALTRDLPTVAAPTYLSPADIVVSPDSQRLYIAEKTAKQISVVDCATKTVLKKIKLPNEVTGIAVAPDGAKLYATCSSDLWPAGMVCEVDISSGKVVRRIAVGHSVRAPVMAPDGKTLYACNVYDNDLSVIDLASGKETARIPVVREPYSAGITPDGSVLVVANSLPAEKATDTLNITCRISLIATGTRQVVATIPLTRGSHSAFGLTVSPDGNYAFITHLVAMFTIPAVQIEGGWIHTNNCAIIDIKGRRLLNDVTLDRATMGSANPWGVACTRDGSIICIAHSGSNELSVIDLKQMITKASAGRELERDFQALYSIRQKVPVKGKAPRALAIVGNKAYTAGYFGDDVEIFDLTPSLGPDLAPDAKASGTITLGPAKALTPRRKGEFHFFDASICYEKWQSCHSCHPFTRPDALNWILNTQNSTPKNAKNMLHSWWTPPTSWAGKRPAAGGIDGSIRSGISSELFIQPSEEVGVPLDTFFMRLAPVPSPFLIKGRLSAAAVRGKAIYSRIGCNHCHPAPLYTDKSFHNAGVEDPYDANTQWDTPSLIEAWRTGPFGHLGSYENIGDIIRLRAHSIGATQLSQEEFGDLIQYILSL
ncbi:MAG: hypothetical protein JXA71_10790 [Chitinispirillaceae bacterium]|nr:hypothetical protein [Chitinispirillaceae bacterium]